MRYYVSDKMRLFICQRAVFKCEYCKLHESYANYKFHIEHIIAMQHGGLTVLSNLALACSNCNLKKVPNLSTVLALDGPLIRLFNPRKDIWQHHFEVENGVFYGKTEVGEATIKLLELNTPEYIIERIELASLGIFQ
jgi:hypothetical protein